MFGEVVIHHKGMTTCVTEELANRSTGERSVILHGCRVAGCGTDNDGVIHCTLLPESVDDGGNGRSLLSDGDVDTIDGLPCFVVCSLIDDGVDGNGSLPSLSVTDNQFSLSSADGNHGVYGLQSGLQRLVHGLTEDDPWGFTFQRHVESLSRDGALSIDRMSESVDHTPYHAFAYGDGGDASCSLHGITFFNAVRGAQ